MMLIIVGMLFGVVIVVIFVEVGFEFLGFGDFSIVSWGMMFYWVQNFNFLFIGQWLLLFVFGFCIVLLVLSLILINFGVDGIFNLCLCEGKG